MNPPLISAMEGEILNRVQKIATSRNFFLLSAHVIFLQKNFHFEVSVCLPLWDSLCTSPIYFFQVVLQLCAENWVKNITRRSDFSAKKLHDLQHARDEEPAREEQQPFLRSKTDHCS